MPAELFKIPFTRWVLGTVDKMTKYGYDDFQDWSQAWLQTYKELGGTSVETGKKQCPKHAAYALWQLGRIKNTDKPFQNLSLASIYDQYGKNAVYAVLSIDLLSTNQAAQNNAFLWHQVQSLFLSKLHEEPAESQQGAVTVARILFDEGHIAKQLSFQ